MPDPLPALGLAALAAAVLAILLLARLWRRGPRAVGRPQWARMLAETEYFRKVLTRVFRQRGYAVRGVSVLHDPREDEAREVLFALRQGGTLYAALCVRWVVPVTSDVIERFEKALALTKARSGMIVTTSIFTPAALDRARGLPVELYHRGDLQKWIDQGWPN